MAEKVARLSDEQWNVIKTALDGEITDLRIQTLRLEAKNAAMREALGEYNLHLKVKGQTLISTGAVTQKLDRIIALSSDAGKGCEHEFTGPPGAYPYIWSRCLKCKMIVERPGEKGWVSPEVMGRLDVLLELVSHWEPWYRHQRYSWHNRAKSCDYGRDPKPARVVFDDGRPRFSGDGCVRCYFDELRAALDALRKAGT